MPLQQCFLGTLAPVIAHIQNTYPSSSLFCTPTKRDLTELNKKVLLHDENHAYAYLCMSTPCGSTSIACHLSLCTLWVKSLRRCSRTFCKMNSTLFSHIYWPISWWRHTHSGASFPTRSLWGSYKFIHENAPCNPQRLTQTQFKIIITETLCIHFESITLDTESISSLNVQLLPPMRKPTSSFRSLGFYYG